MFAINATFFPIIANICLHFQYYMGSGMEEAPQWNTPLCLNTEGASAFWRKFHKADKTDSR